MYSPPASTVAKEIHTTEKATDLTKFGDKSRHHQGLSTSTFEILTLKYNSTYVYVIISILLLHWSGSGVANLDIDVLPTKKPTFLVLTPPCPLGGYCTSNWSCNALEFGAMYTSFLPVEEQIANDGRYVLALHY